MVLDFDTVVWRHGDRARVAAGPALDIGVVAADEAAVADRVAEDVVGALRRTGTPTSPFGLAAPGRPVRSLRALLRDTPAAGATDGMAAFARETGPPLAMLDPAVPLDRSAVRAEVEPAPRSGRRAW